MLSFPSALNNREPILNVIKHYFEPNNQYKVLEIASGSGEHISFFAKNLPNITFQPSDINPRYIHSIVAYVDNLKLKNLKIPLLIDVTKPCDLWLLSSDFKSQIDAIINSNMIHISSPNATDGLFLAAGKLLKSKTGKLFLYGPFAFDNKIEPQSNINFDKSLRLQNPDWGLKDVENLKKLAKSNGLSLLKIHEMPVNNHMLVFIKEQI